MEILADRDLDLSDLDEESDFYEPSDPEESSKEEMPDNKGLRFARRMRT